jgi:hypothetical protein
MTTVAVADLVDGETFTLNDGYSALVFEFDKNGTGVTAGRVQVNVSTDTTADHVRDRIIAVINVALHTDGTPFRITAVSGGAATVSLKNDRPGTQGNTTSAETVANATFALSNMAGATAGGLCLVKDSNPGKPGQGFYRSCLDRPLIFEAYSTAGADTMSVELKIWAYSPAAGEYLPVGTHSLDADRGTVNEGTAIGETGTDKLRFAQATYHLLQYTHVYCEVAAISGTGTAVTALLRQAE